MSHAGLFDILRIHRTFHIGGTDPAQALALQCLAKYRGRHPVNFADVAACVAWLEMDSAGCYSEATRENLRILDEPRFAGLRALLAAQGFLA